MKINLSEINPPRSLVTRIILLLGGNLTLMSGASLSPAMPAMLREFGAIPGAVFWISMIITLPALFVVIGGPITGFLTDRFGRKPILAGTVLLCGISGSAGYFLTSIGPILITRALVGVSMAGAMTATNALIADYYEGQARAKIMGIQAAVGGLGVVFFLPLGGILADIYWRFTFLAYLPLVVLFPLVILFIDEPAKNIIGKEKTHKERLKINFTVGYIFAAIFSTNFTFMTIPIFMAYFMTALLGAGGLEIGLAGAVSGIFSFIAGVIYERVSRRATNRNIAVFGFILFSVGFLVFGLATSWLTIVLGQMILGFCLGLTGSNLTNWLANEVNQNVRGRANGIYFTMMFLGQFIASFIYAPITQNFGFGSAYILSAVLTGLTGLVGLLIKEQGVLPSTN